MVPGFPDYRLLMNCRFGEIGKYFFRSKHIFFRQFKIDQFIGEVFVIGHQIQQAVSAPVKENHFFLALFLGL